MTPPKFFDRLVLISGVTLGACTPSDSDETSETSAESGVDTDSPETDVPETDPVDTDTPETDPPETDLPETDVPDTDIV